MGKLLASAILATLLLGACALAGEPAADSVTWYAPEGAGASPEVRIFKLAPSKGAKPESLLDSGVFVVPENWPPGNRAVGEILIYTPPRDKKHEILFYKPSSDVKYEIRILDGGKGPLAGVNPRFFPQPRCKGPFPLLPEGAGQ